jgi:carbohydrate ABC transporter membrane protein 1, CUT1 family (TC 3.A.1.1.-)
VGVDKWENNRAWFLILPVFVIVAFSAIIPLMTVVNYSVQDILGPGQRMFVGAEWFREMLTNSRLHDALIKQLIFSGLVLLIEIPLGIAIALTMPHKGWTASVCLVLLALPLLIPWNVIGTIWIIFTRPDIGLLGASINGLGLTFDHTGNPLHAWITVMLMEVWHWTPLVVLLAYAGLRSIPDAYYQAAKIDGASRWAVFRFIQLPKMRGVLDHRRAAQIHGQLSHLRRALRPDRRRPRQRDDLFVHLSGQLSRPWIWARPRPSPSSTFLSSCFSAGFSIRPCRP